MCYVMEYLYLGIHTLILHTLLLGYTLYVRPARLRRVPTLICLARCREGMTAP